MMTTKEFNDNYWKMFDAGIVEDDRKPESVQIQIEELDSPRVYRHFFETSGIEDAKEKIRWLLKNTPCYDLVLYVPGVRPITWCGINDREWEYYYGRLTPAR